MRPPFSHNNPSRWASRKKFPPKAALPLRPSPDGQVGMVLLHAVTMSAAAGGFGPVDCYREDLCGQPTRRFTVGELDVVFAMDFDRPTTSLVAHFRPANPAKRLSPAFLSNMRLPPPTVVPAQDGWRVVTSVRIPYAPPAIDAFGMRVAEMAQIAHRHIEPDPHYGADLV
jgi:hypothetical protein